MHCQKEIYRFAEVTGSSSCRDNTEESLDNAHHKMKFQVPTDCVFNSGKSQLITSVCDMRERVDDKVDLQELENLKNQQLSVSSHNRGIKDIFASLGQNMDGKEFADFLDYKIQSSSSFHESEPTFPSDLPKGLLQLMTHALQKSATLLSVKVVNSDIVDENVDVIVNTTNKYFTFDGPLSRYIFRKAGNNIRNDMVVVDDEIRISGSGNLKCKEIFHVAIPDLHQSMEAFVFKILKLADERGFNKIALPAIGAGHGGWKVEEISASFQSAFNKFKSETVNIELIMVVLSPRMSCDERVSFHENVNIQNEHPRSPPEEGDRSTQLVTSWLSQRSSSTKSEGDEEELTPINASHHAIVFVSAGSRDNVSSVICDIQKLAQRRIKENLLSSVSTLRLEPSVSDDGENIQSENVSSMANENEGSRADFNSMYLGQTHYTAPISRDINITLENLPVPREPSDAFMNIEKVKDFINTVVDTATCKKWCENTSPLVWEEMKVEHKPLTKPTIQLISYVVNCSNDVDELEFRDCAPTAELLRSLCNDRPTDRGGKISEFAITGEDDVSMLISEICTILKDHSGNALGLSENNLTDEAIKDLKECLKEIGVTSLLSLDVSDNEEISNYSTLAEVLNTSRMKELQIRNCGITPKRLEDLGSHLIEKLKRLDISFNSEMCIKCFSRVGDLLQKTADYVGLSGCDLTEAKAQTLFQSFERLGIQLKALDLSYNCDLRYNGVSVISRFIPICKLSELSLAGCNIDADCIVVLRRNLKGYKLTKLDLSDNSPMHDDGVKNLGLMTAECLIENLNLSNCALSSKQIGIFGDSLGKYKISKLDISDGQLMLNSNMVEAIKSVTMKVVDELTLCYENIDEFVPALKSVNKSLKIIYGYLNNRHEIELVTFLPKVQCKEKLLHEIL